MRHKLSIYHKFLFSLLFYPKDDADTFYEFDSDSNGCHRACIESINPKTSKNYLHGLCKIYIRNGVRDATKEICISYDETNADKVYV